MPGLCGVMVNKTCLGIFFACGLRGACFGMDSSPRAIDIEFFRTMRLDEHDLEAVKEQIHLYTDFFVGRQSHIDVNFLIPIISANFAALILTGGQPEHSGIRKIYEEYYSWENNLRALLLAAYLHQEPAFIDIPDFIVQGYAVIPAYTLCVQEVKERVSNLAFF